MSHLPFFTKPLATALPLWRPKALFILLTVAALLLGSFYTPYTRQFWEILDQYTFRLLNSWIATNPYAQTFWAIFSHKNADWFEDMIFLVLFISYIRGAALSKRPFRIAQLFYIAIVLLFVILCVNRGPLHDYNGIERESPSLTVEGAIRLSDEVTWLKFKDSSHKSFPADHATTAILFGSLFGWMARGKLAIFSSIYCIFLILPRLINGAHWLSDVLVGSGTISLVALAFFLCTPLYLTLLVPLEALSNFFYALFQRLRRS